MCWFDNDGDGDVWLKDECADCDFCQVDDLFHEAVCKNRELCKYRGEEST